MTMTGDPLATVGLATREVRNGSRDGAPTKIAIARRTYRTDQGDLWDAVTNGERIPRWFLPVSGELAPGGRYQLEGNAGGVVERCEKPDSFAVTWEYGEMMSWLEVNLSLMDDGTMLELVHEAPVDPDTWVTYGPGAVGVGWDLGLMGLGLHLDTGAPVDPELALTFPASPEGVEFIRQAAAGWADAAIEAGDEPGVARAGAASTISFYTGTPES
jgi:uncharacterized protein YndB with AHSA1/START domain